MLANNRRTLCIVALLLFLSSCGSPSITPPDTSAANLDLKITVLDNPDSSDGKNIVLVQFLYDGRTVRFAGGETINCNGVPLTFDELTSSYTGRVAIETVGSAYKFVYIRDGISSSVSLNVPDRPVIISPLAGDSIPRTNDLTITYVPGTGTGIDAGASSTSNSVTRNVFLPDNGTYTGLDVSSLEAGPGSIHLTRRFESTVSGTDFKSVSTTYDSFSEDVGINWE